MASPTVRGNALEWSSDGVRVEITALGGRVSEVDDPTETLPNRPTFHYAPPGYVLDAEVFAIKFTADAVTPWNDQMNGLAFSIRMGGTHVETPLLPKPLSGNPGAITLGGVLSRVDNSDRWVFKSHAPYNAIDPRSLRLPGGNISDPFLSLDVGFIDVIVHRVNYNPDERVVHDAAASVNRAHRPILYRLRRMLHDEDRIVYWRFFFRDYTVLRNWFPGRRLPASVASLSFGAQLRIVENFITYLRRLDPDQPDPDDD